ncbi:thiamine diphosphokinase [uncultured Ilyobacter sp.]|uniref:thiamine diphosphokinase n=1 Tax=uncultured Ilyobacter sp. TaxID=544433 RepID=UPI0029C9713F|nr:thiamine diphosphokinase [uncultured Ilyobacter sp.]
MMIDTITMKRAFVFLNGELSENMEFYQQFLKKNGDIYCADGGAMHTYRLGKVPVEIIGDMDSVSEEVLKHYENNGTLIRRFSKEKDFTDGEIILEYLNSKSYDEIIIFAALGGRTDHMLTNLNLIFKYKKARFISEKEEIFSIDRYFKFENKKGSEVSFIPFSNEVGPLTLKGFKFPLNKHRLKRGSSICMSNIIIENTAEVNFENGALLCIVQK